MNAHIDQKDSRQPRPDETDTAAVNALHRGLFGRLIGLAWRHRGTFLLVLGLTLAMEAMALIGLRSVGLGIDYLHHQLDPSAPEPRWPLGLAIPASWQPMEGVFAIACGVLGAALFAAALRFLGALTQAILVQRVVVDLRSDVFAKLQRLSFRFYDANESGSIINRVTGDVQGTRMFLDQVLLQGLITVSRLAVYAFYMVQLDVSLTVACLATAPFMAWRAGRFGAVVKPAYRESRRLVDNMVRALSENVQGVHVVKGFSREGQEIARFDQANAEVRDQKRWIFKKVTVFGPTIHLLSEISMVVLLAYGGWLFVQGQLALGDGLVVFAGLLQQFNSQVTNIAGITNSIQNSLTSAARVFEVLDAPIEVHDRPDARPLPSVEGRVRFEHVDFGYRDDDPVLHDITLDVQPGEVVALLGATGAGKSSLLSLIPRFYDPTSGRVRIDGHDLRDVCLADLRRHIGIVFQENFLFSTTVAANIAFGHPDATREQIEAAARIAQADGFVRRLSKGYDTVIGEKGADLSGGQRQRIAIARAILPDPKILLLDDATAAIDPETEHEILTAMDRAMEGRTTFIIAHRLSTLRRADRVVVLDHGRIVETGRHDELVGLHGVYAEVAEAQCAGGESRRLLGMEAGR